jgi:hypothetical protein
MTLFSGGSLVIAAGSIAVALRLFPLWKVVALLAADCVLHHLTKAAAGEWWIVGDASRSGLAHFMLNVLTNSVLWLWAHKCLNPTMRVTHPGSHHARTCIMSSDTDVHCFAADTGLDGTSSHGTDRCVLHAGGGVCHLCSTAAP